MSNVPAVQQHQSPTPTTYEPMAAALDQAKSLFAVTEPEWQRMWHVSQVLAGSQLVPDVLKGNPQGVMAVGLHCRALQVPFSGLSVKTHFHVWKDSRGIVIQPAAQLMLGMLWRAGHDAWWGPCDDTSATLHVIRAGSTRQMDFTYTEEMAGKAGLLSKDNWKHHPGPMLRAAVARMGSRYAAPEALMGLDAFERWETPPPAAAPVVVEPELAPGAEGERLPLETAEPYDPQNPGDRFVDEELARQAKAIIRRTRRLMRQIDAIPADWRKAFRLAWDTKGLPSYMDLGPEHLDAAEEVVDAITAQALASPAADTVTQTGQGDEAAGGTGHAPTAGVHPERGEAHGPDHTVSSPQPSRARREEGAPGRASDVDSPPAGPPSQQQAFDGDDPGRPFE